MPFPNLALPGVILAYKYSQFRQRRRDANNRKVTERELSALHHKIDKLLSKLEESEPELPTSSEDECVICINERSTMQTMPCGHKVVCRRCFVKTIQSAVAQRLLPLRCVICRTRVSRLTTGTGTWRLQGSSSSYSMGSKSWNVPGSASSYSVGAKVAASASLYSMSSGSSCMSGVSNTSSGLSSGSSSTTSSNDPLKHRHHETCSSGCLGAIPRNPTHSYRQLSQIHSKNRYPDMPNRLPPIKEFRSPSKLPTPSPVHTTNPKFRFSSYTSYTGDSITTKSTTNNNININNLNNNNNNIKQTSSTKLGLSSKVAPMNSKSPINKNNMVSVRNSMINNNNNTQQTQRVLQSSASTSSTSSSTNKHDEKSDNKKNESMEKKKKEEKLKIKAEKEARKEEKRIAKEEERLAKMLAKEEKKRGKREAKELLLN